MTQAKSLYSGKKTKPKSEAEPLLPRRVWSLHLAHLMRDAVLALPRVDWAAFREHHPELYTQIKAKEAELDQLSDARLSEIRSILEAWKELILAAQVEK